MAGANIRYIGHFDVLADGKLLLELLCQLRNLGVGRMVTKGEWLRKWPKQPSYCLIRKVTPKMDRWLMAGTVWADWIYRGKNLGLYTFEQDLYRPDWRLIHRADEAAMRECERPFEQHRLPARLPLPPLHRIVHGVEPAFGGVEAPATVPLVPRVDAEHDMLRPYVQQTDELNPAPSIYDADPQLFLDLYGDELPTRLDAWHCFDENDIDKLDGFEDER